eukprot:3353-Heterococcus_DN1.PRE.8
MHSLLHEKHGRAAQQHLAQTLTMMSFGSKHQNIRKMLQRIVHSACSTNIKQDQCDASMHCTACKHTPVKCMLSAAVRLRLALHQQLVCKTTITTAEDTPCAHTFMSLTPLVLAATCARRSLKLSAKQRVPCSNCTIPCS